MDTTLTYVFISHYWDKDGPRTHAQEMARYISFSRKTEGWQAWHCIKAKSILTNDKKNCSHSNIATLTTLYWVVRCLMYRVVRFVCVFRCACIVVCVCLCTLFIYIIFLWPKDKNSRRNTKENRNTVCCAVDFRFSSTSTSSSSSYFPLFHFSVCCITHRVSYQQIRKRDGVIGRGR